jgi:SPP1 family predicted phage head-tail adaptor
MTTIDAGKFDRRVTLEAKTQTQSELGDLEVTWTAIATVWARKLSSKGREFYSGNQILGADDVGIQIRYSNAVAVIDLTSRFIFDGKTYNIKSIDEVDRKNIITIFGTAGTNNG